MKFKNPMGDSVAIRKFITPDFIYLILVVGKKHLSMYRLFSGKLIEPRIIGRHFGVNGWLKIDSTTGILGHDSNHSHCSTDVFVLHQRRTFVAMAGASSI